jgi:hypothetical protein
LYAGPWTGDPAALRQAGSIIAERARAALRLVLARPRSPDWYSEGAAWQ